MFGKAGRRDREDQGRRAWPDAPIPVNPILWGAVRIAPAWICAGSGIAAARAFS
jgi:hypothetical protein